MTHATIGSDGYPTYAAFLAASIDDDYDVLVRQGDYNETIVWNKAGRLLYIHGDSIMEAASDFTGSGANDFPVFDQQGIRQYGIQVVNGGVIAERIATVDPTVSHYREELTHGPQDFQALNCRTDGGVNVFQSAESRYSRYFLGCYFLNNSGNAIECYSYVAAENDNVNMIRGNIFRIDDDSLAPGFVTVVSLVGDGTRGGIYNNLIINDPGLTPGNGYMVGPSGAGAIVQGNMVIDMSEYGSRGIWGQRPWYYYDNFWYVTTNTGFTHIYCNDSQDRDIFRNLIDNGLNRGIHASPAATGTIRVYNNIIMNCNNGLLVDAGATVDNQNNCYFNNFLDRFGGGVYNNPDPGVVAADPQRDPTSHRSMALLSTSPCIQAGLADGLPTIQALPDIGCQQYRPGNFHNDDN